MFSSLADAQQRRAQQQALDVLRASKLYEEARKDNPTMLQSNYIDFSNPESVNTILNPYGTFNPYANPNVTAQNPGYNPYAYMSPTYSGTWYGSSNIWGISDTARYMIANKEDIEEGRLTTSKVVEVPINEEIQKEEEPKESLSYTEKVEEAITSLQVKVVTVSTVEEKKQESFTDGPKFVVIKNTRPHMDHMPYDNSELDMNRQEMKTIADTPLNWTENDENELSSISDQIAVYDKSLAHTLWNIPTLDDITREDWHYFRRYALEKLQDFRNKERMNPQIDYRAPYRYRPLPAVYKTEDGDLMPDLNIPIPVAFKSVNIDGDVVYSYDRVRDLTDEEWDIFVDRSYAEMLEAGRKMKAEDLLNINKGLVEESKTNVDNTPLPAVNPYDPISVRVFQAKLAERQYNNYKAFFRDVFRSRMNDEEFDNWWYGTNTANSRKPMTQLEANRAWAKQMTDLNIQELNKVRILDPVQTAQYYNNLELAAINNFTKGTMRKDMSAKEAWDNIGYLVNRIHEMNMEEQKKQQAQQYYQNMSHDTFRKSLYQFMNTGNATNPNPNYTSQYGTIDPRFGLPSNYVDITNTPEIQAKRERFLNYCNTTQGPAPLSPIYK